MMTLPGVGMRQPAENVEQGRLAAARGADDGDELTLLDCERNAAQGRHIDLADAVGLAHVLSLNHPPHANLRYYTIFRSGHSAGTPVARAIRATTLIVPKASPAVKHAQLVARAADWLRLRYGCGIVLSEQYCATGEVPDVIGWKASCQSVLVECKVSRADFLADADKAFRLKPEEGLGSRRLYMAPAGMIAAGRVAETLGAAGVPRT